MAERLEGKRVTIRNRTRMTRNISLRREYAGIDGRCLYIRPKEAILAPAAIVSDLQLVQEAKHGYVTVTGDKAEPKRKETKTSGRRARSRTKKEG